MVDKMKKKYYLASFSGGKDSTAMVLELIKRECPLDEVMFCDTYKEFPQMYEHIEKVKKLVENKGIKFTVLKSEKSFDYYMFEHEPKRGSDRHLGKKGFSFPTSRIRWCTSFLKLDVVKRYIKTLDKDFAVCQYLGIACDEGYRLERESNKKEGLLFPLVEWEWDEKMCLDYCFKLGYDWSGLYEHFERVSCWLCPLQSLSDLRSLYKHYPSLWVELLDMEERTWMKFRADYSVKELDLRFKLEEIRESLGLCVNFRKKEFRESYRRALENGLDVEVDYMKKSQLNLFSE